MAPMSTPVIEVDDFTMRFGAATVVDHLSFDVQPGETFGLLGANGCGKTTTLRGRKSVGQGQSVDLGGRRIITHSHRYNDT